MGNQSYKAARIFIYEFTTALPVVSNTSGLLRVRIDQTKSYADTLIAKRLHSTVSKPVILVGEDSDLIILLHHVKDVHQTILMASSYEASWKPDIIV